MIITFISQEKNLGILTLTDFILNDVLGKDTAVIGWNYLHTEYSDLLDRIKKLSLSKSVIIKYVIPKIKFSNQDFSYPKELLSISDLVFVVPTYREEIAAVTPIKILKGSDNPVVIHIKRFYGV